MGLSNRLWEPTVFLTQLDNHECARRQILESSIFDSLVSNVYVYIEENSRFLCMVLVHKIELVKIYFQICIRCRAIEQIRLFSISSNRFRQKFSRLVLSNCVRFENPNTD